MTANVPSRWLLALLVGISVGSAVAWPWSPVVDTEFGKVEGTTHSFLPFSGLSAVDSFWGIPYAAPPTGDNRFKPPQPFDKPWAPKTRAATSRGNWCTQLDIAGVAHMGDEDCLFLNVFKPRAAKPGSHLPVFVFIHGGGYIIGDGYQEGLYDANTVVGKHGHVVVTLNYRMSALGFMALPELQQEQGTVGNYALQDQRAALQWVQRNIFNFGGDPNSVTVAGESAGAFSVMWHLVSPRSAGLFHAAIMESGTSRVDWFFQKKSEAFGFYSNFSASLGCKGEAGEERLRCLRAVPAYSFVYSFAQMAKDIASKLAHLPIPANIPDFASPLWPIMPFGPVVDGSAEGLLDVPIKLIEKGQFNKVPLILGANKDGGAYFGPAAPLFWGGVLPDMKDFTEWFLPQKADQKRAMELYGSPDFGLDLFRQDRAMRDLMFQCSNRALAKMWSNAGLPAYLYAFSFDLGIVSPIEYTLGDAHAFELPFVFKNYVKILGDLAIDEHNYMRMSDIMSCSWASFVRCQAPRCPDQPPGCENVLTKFPEWSRFSTSNPEYYSLATDPALKAIRNHTVFQATDEFPGNDRCDFWDHADLDFRNVRDRALQRWFRFQAETELLV